MFGLTLSFFLLSVVAAYLGFFGLAGPAAIAVQLLFMVFLILLAASALVSLMHDEQPPV